MKEEANEGFYSKYSIRADQPGAQGLDENCTVARIATGRRQGLTRPWSVSAMSHGGLSSKLRVITRGRPHHDRGRR